MRNMLGWSCWAHPQTWQSSASASRANRTGRMSSKLSTTLCNRYIYASETTNVQHTHPLAARGNAAAISSNQRCHLALLHLPESGRAASALCSDLLPLRSDVATGNRSDRCREPRRLRRLVGGETRESRPPQAVASPFRWSSPPQPRPAPFTSGLYNEMMQEKILDGVQGLLACAHRILARQNVASSAARLLPAPQEGDSTSDGGDC